MSHKPYFVATIDLTTAGSRTFDGGWGVCRFLRAVDGAGVQQPNALVSVKAGNDGDVFPLVLGQAGYNADTTRWIVAWDAQPGIVATFVFARLPSDADWDSTPSALVIGGSLTLARPSQMAAGKTVAVTHYVTTLLLAANANRTRALITYGDGNTLPAAPINITGDVGGSDGALLYPGKTLQIFTDGAVYGYIGAAATDATVFVVEEEA